MQKPLISTVIAMFIGVAYADTINGPNDVPFFYGMIGQDPKYHDAAFAAQRAFLIQTGFTPMYDKLNSYVSTESTRIVTTTIDTYTPFKSKDVFFALGTAYTVCIKKQVTRTFRDPFNHNITHTVSVNTSSVSADIKIPF